MIEPQTFKAGMRRLASGIALVTTAHEGIGHGLAATSVTALTAEPPTLLVCIHRSASCHDAIAAAGRFCVNILTAEHVDLLALFADSSRRADRFAGPHWKEPAAGPPRLVSALASFDCSIARTIGHGTHTILIGDIHQICLHDEGDALVYFNGAARPLPA